MREPSRAMTGFSREWAVPNFGDASRDRLVVRDAV